MRTKTYDKRMAKNKEKKMKTRKIHSILLGTVVLLALCSGTYAQDAGKTIDTRIGKLSFTHDFANG